MNENAHDTGIDAMEMAMVTPAFEYMGEATPEMVKYAMECYIDGLIQKGMTRGEAMQKALRVTRDAIGDAHDEADSLSMKGSGNHEYNYEYTYTTDDKVWRSVLFETLEDARRYATQIIAENEENPKFASFARKMVLVSLSDFMDSSKSAVELTVISKVTTIL